MLSPNLLILEYLGLAYYRLQFAEAKIVLFSAVGFKGNLSPGHVFGLFPGALSKRRSFQFGWLKKKQLGHTAGFSRFHFPRYPQLPTSFLVGSVGVLIFFLEVIKVRS